MYQGNPNLYGRGITTCPKGRKGKVHLMGVKKTVAQYKAHKAFRVGRKGDSKRREEQKGKINGGSQSALSWGAVSIGKSTQSEITSHMVKSSPGPYTGG